MKHDEKILEIKEELLNEYGIKTDRDLVKQLGISQDDKKKLYKWIEYQCAYSYRNGYENGQEELKEQLYSLIKPTESNRYL